MNDDQKTNEQLLEELAQERVLLGRERERSAQAEERSLALQEVSKRVAGAHDTDEVLDLIVNEAASIRPCLRSGSAPCWTSAAPVCITGPREYSRETWP